MPRPSRKTSDKEQVTVPAVAVTGCTVAYGRNVVLEDVSFSVGQGEIAAVIGPNGSGKTTLIKAVLGLVPAAAGEIRVFGKHFHAVRNLIGYVPQRFDFDRNFPITVAEFMDLARHPHCPKSRIQEKMREVGLPAKVLDEQLGNLSGGQLQRALIAQAILNNPQILFLDEPSSGIDIAGEATFYELIEHLNVEHKTTILLVSHDVAMVSGIVDNVICVNKKLLCYGPPQAALTAKKISELFGPESHLYDHPHHDDRHGHGNGTHDHGH
jgi:ABC-type Mn2+/Zn2+ transport system ATPase subunit